MKWLLWAVTFAAAGVWSIFAWGAHALIGWFGGLATSGTGPAALDPEAMAWIRWIAEWLTNLGLAGVVIVWLVGMSAILAAALVLRVIGRTLIGRGSGWAAQTPAGSAKTVVLRVERLPRPPKDDDRSQR